MRLSRRLTRERLESVRYETESGVGENDEHVIRDVAVVDREVWEAILSCFTWEDVDHVRRAAKDVYWAAHNHGDRAERNEAKEAEKLVLNLADRIEALLPPRESE